jgi:iron complex transport system permease protein
VDTQRSGPAQWVPAPSQLAAGLVTALIGAPYFVWLLWRSRSAW